MGESWGKRESVWERCEYVCARENIYVSASREAEIYVCAYVRVQVERVIQRRVDDLTLLCFSPG